LGLIVLFILMIKRQNEGNDLKVERIK